MGLPQPNSSEINSVYVVTQKMQGEVMLHLGAVHLRGPVPAQLIQGFQHRKAGQTPAVFRGAVAPQEGLACDEMAERVEMGPLLVRGLLGQVAVGLSHKGALQVPQILIDFVRCHGTGWGGVQLGHEPLLLYGMVRGRGGRLVQAEVRGLEMQIEQGLSPCEVQRTLLRGAAGALLEPVRDRVGGKGAVLQGIGPGAGDGLVAVDVAQGHDLAHGMVRVEASLFELPVLEFGLGRAREKAHEELVITGFSALLQQRFGMIRVFKVALAVVAAGVAGDEFVVLREAKPVGRGLQG
jgi:hypothetical protein